MFQAKKGQQYTIKYQVLWLMKTYNPTTDFWLGCLYETMSRSAICYLWIFEMKWALVGKRAERFPAEEPFSELRPSLWQHFLVICLIQSQCIQSASQCCPLLSQWSQWIQNRQIWRASAPITTECVRYETSSAWDERCCFNFINKPQLCAAVKAREGVEALMQIGYRVYYKETLLHNKQKVVTSEAMSNRSIFWICCTVISLDFVCSAASVLQITYK